MQKKFSELPEPVTCMTVYNGKLYVACGCQIWFQKEVDGVFYNAQFVSEE